MNEEKRYSAVTRGIRVSVEPAFLEEKSNPLDGRYFWSYRVTIENESADTVQLWARHWQITDSIGRVHEVQGLGVVGEQPILDPGEAYEYTSGTPLDTPSGVMVGQYQMIAPSGETFEVDVPAFSLDSPHENRVLN